MLEGNFTMIKLHKQQIISYIFKIENESYFQKPSI